MFYNYKFSHTLHSGAAWKKNNNCASLGVFLLWTFPLEKAAEVTTVWLKKPWGGGVGVGTVIYIYSLPRHLGGCYPGGLCGSSLKHTHTFFLNSEYQHTLADFDTATYRLWVMCSLTVKTGWVDAGTWMPSGIKHYYTFETLLHQRRLCTGTELSRGKKAWKAKKIKVEKVLFC